MFFKSKRTYIVQQAVIALIVRVYESNFFIKSEGFDQEPLQLILREQAASIKKPIATPERKKYHKHVEVGDQPQNKKEKDKKVSLQVQIAETNQSCCDQEHTESTV